MGQITEQLLRKGMSTEGSYSEEQLNALGLKTGKDFKFGSFMTKKGWKQALIGREISYAKASLFLDLKKQEEEKIKRAKKDKEVSRKWFAALSPGEKEAYIGKVMKRKQSSKNILGEA